MSIQEILARLKTLAKQAGENYYERIQLVACLLADRDWVVAEFGDDQYACASMLEETYLHDLCAAMSIFDLLKIYRAFPHKNKWEAEKYNLRKLLALASPKDKPQQCRRHATIGQLDQLTKEKQDLTYQLKKGVGGTQGQGGQAGAGKHRSRRQGSGA